MVTIEVAMDAEDTIVEMAVMAVDKVDATVAAAEVQLSSILIQVPSLLTR